MGTDINKLTKEKVAIEMHLNLLNQLVEEYSDKKCKIIADFSTCKAQGVATLMQNNILEALDGAYISMIKSTLEKLSNNIESMISDGKEE